MHLYDGKNFKLPHNQIY